MKCVSYTQIWACGHYPSLTDKKAFNNASNVGRKMKFKTFLYSGTAGLATCLFVSCGGGDGNLSPLASNNAPPPAPMPVDSQAPTLNFTGSSTDVQGGETVVLSVLANDNVDAQVSSTLSCDRGTLNGDFLSIAETDAPFIITCTANASDAAGNTASETLEISVQTTETVLDLFTPSESLTPGEFGRVNIDGVALTGEALSGTFNGEDITLTRAPDGGLLFLTPLDAAVGTSELQLTIDGRIFSFSPMIEPALIVTDPEGTLREALEASSQVVTDFLNADDVTDAQRAQLEMLQADINTNIQNLGDVPASELMEAAQIFVANTQAIPPDDAVASAPISLAGKPSFSQSVSQATGFNEIGCRLFIVSVAGAALSVNGLVVTQVTPVTALANLAFVGVFGVLAVDTSQACFDINDISNNIFTVGTVPSFSVSNSTQTKAASFAVSAPQSTTLKTENLAVFEDGIAREVSFSAQETISPVFEEELTEIINSIISGFEALSFIPESVIDSTRELIEPNTVELPFDEITLSNITNTAIMADLTEPNLTFTQDANVNDDFSSNIDFSFDVNHISGVSTTIPAQLNVLPEADDVMVMVTAGETVTGTVQTRGAESVRLASNPAQGQATLETDGAFSYTANSGASGQDSFNYEAVNVNGVSDPATVFVDIEALNVIARDTSIVLPAGESVTFEVDSENATSWSLSLVDGEIPPVEFFPTVGFFPENPPGFITIETSDDAQGEFNLTYIAQNGEVSDTGVISIFVTAEEEDDLPGPEVSVIFPNPVLPGRTELIGVTGGPSNPEISRFLLDNGGLNTENGLLEIDSFTRLVYTANADAMVGLDTFIVNVELGDGTVEAIRVGVQIAEDPFIGFYDVVATSDSPNPCNNINLQPSDEVGVSYEWSFEIAYSIENQEYTAILPDEWAALQLTNNGQNRTNIIGGTSNPPSNRQIISEPEGLRLRLIESSFNDANGLDETYELDFQPNSTFSNPLEGRYDITDRDENGAIECIIRYRFVIEERE